MAEEESDSKTTASFIDKKTIKSFAGASAALTVLINVILIIYGQIERNPMPNAALAGLGILLCVAYSLSFQKRSPGIGVTEYIWLTAINSAILFSSLTGLNNILKTAGDAYAQQPVPVKTTASPTAMHNDYKVKAMEAGFDLSELKNIIIPKQTWTSPHIDESVAVSEIRTNATVATTKALLLASTSKAALTQAVTIKDQADHSVDSLTTALKEVRAQYIQQLNSLANYGGVVNRLTVKLKDCGTVEPAITQQISSLQNAIQESKTTQAQQQQQQQALQQVQVKRGAQAVMQKRILQQQQSRISEAAKQIQVQQRVIQ